MRSRSVYTSPSMAAHSVSMAPCAEPRTPRAGNRETVDVAHHRRALDEGLHQLRARTYRHQVAELIGWGARIRTWECGSQSPVPYRLATPQD